MFNSLGSSWLAESSSLTCRYPFNEALPGERRHTSFSGNANRGAHDAWQLAAPRPRTCLEGFHAVVPAGHGEVKQTRRHLPSAIRPRLRVAGGGSALRTVLFEQRADHRGSVTSVFTELTKAGDSLGMIKSRLISGAAPTSANRLRRDAPRPAWLPHHIIQLPAEISAKG